MRLQRLESGRRRLHEPVRRRPAAQSASRPAPERAAEVRIHRQQIGRGSLARLRVLQRECQQRQIVLGIVDGVRRVSRCGPACPGPKGPLCPPREVGEPRQRAFGGTHDLQAIERGNAGAPLREIDPRPGQNDLAARGADREPQREPLGGDPALGGLQLRQREPFGVAKQRIFHDFLWEKLLRQARHEHAVEREPAGGGDRRDEHLPMALAGRRHRELAETASEDYAHFAQGDGTDGPHRGELGQK